MGFNFLYCLSLFLLFNQIDVSHAAFGFGAAAAGGARSVFNGRYGGERLREEGKETFIKAVLGGASGLIILVWLVVQGNKLVKWCCKKKREDLEEAETTHAVKCELGTIMTLSNNMSWVQK